MNYYAVLGVAPDADPDRIRSTFRALVRQYHPDVGEGSSVEKFRQILTAYETLSDPIRRAYYDRTLPRERTQVGAPVHIEPLIPQPAAESLLRRGRNAPTRYHASRPYRPFQLDDLIDEFVHTWQEAFLGEVWRNRV